MSKTERQAMVEELTASLGASTNIYVTDFTGLDVHLMTQLRRQLRDAGARYVVVKNTLARRALAAQAITALDGHLTGPVGLVLAGADPLPAAKVIRDFAKAHSRPALTIGMVDGKPVEAAYIQRLGELPSRDVLLAQVAGMLNGMLYQVVGVLEALCEKRQADS